MRSTLSNVASPVSVIGDHINTLRTGSSKRKFSFGAVVVLYFLPIFFGLLAACVGSGFAETGALLSAVAVYTGLIVNLAFNIFDKSLTIRNDPFQEGDEETIALVDELFANVNYTVIVGLVTTALLVSASFFRAPPQFSWLANVTTFLIASCLAHLFMMSGMIMKRFRALRIGLKR